MTSRLSAESKGESVILLLNEPDEIDKTDIQSRVTVITLIVAYRTNDSRGHVFTVFTVFTS